MTITLGFDTETKGLSWYDPAEQAFLFSWADDTGSYVGRVDRKTHRDKFVKALKRADRLVAHNLPFDTHQLRATLGIDVLDMGKDVVDTDPLARIVLPERATASDEDGLGRSGYKLKDLAKTFLRADADAAEAAILELAESIEVKLKGDTATPGGYYLVWRAYPKEMEHYAKLDAEYARDLLPILEKRLANMERQREVWDVERTVQPIIIRAEARGVALDQDVVEKLRAEYEPLRDDALKRWQEWIGPDVNPGSRNELREALLAKGVPLHRTTKNGELSTAQFALQEFTTQFPGLKALEDWRAADKMLSTYIGPMTGRATVHPSFWQIGAWTGRMSCSRPNMQNLPARDEPGSTKLREVFVPRPGYVFVVNDYEQIELKMLAMYLNDPDFTALIESGYDAFAWLAAEVDGGNAEDYFKGTPGAKRRGDLKNVTYAICYGAGAGRINDMLGLDPGPYADANHFLVQKGWKEVGDPLYGEANAVINKVKNALPRYLDLASTRRPKGRVPKRIEAVGYVTTIMGRKQVVNKDKAYVGLNALIQGGAADIFKAGLIEIDRRFREADIDGQPVLFVHDEVVSEVREEQAELALKLQTEAMEAAHTMRPALKAEGTIAKDSYAQAK